MRSWNEWNKESFVVRTNALLVNTLISTGEVSVSICDCWQNNDHTSILGMNLAVEQQEELAARKGREKVLAHSNPAVSQLRRLHSGGFSKKMAKIRSFPSSSFLALGKKNVCVIAVAKQLSLQFILTVLVFQFPEFFLPKWYFFSSAGVVTVQ